MAGSLLRKPTVLVPVVLVVVVCIAVVVFIYKRSGAYEPPPLAFDGPSDQLKQTVIVPTLDTPMPEGKNVIWCASFQLAWNEFKDDVIGEPVKMAGAQDIADRLNTSTITTAVLEPGDYYAKAGFVEDGIMATIERDMAARFPDVPKPDLQINEISVAVAYAYLQVSIEFSQMFYENNDEFLFRGVPVTSFGIRETDKKPDDPARRQVFVLYSSEKEGEPWSDENEFVLNLSLGTGPYEIILARIEPKGTLAETLAELERKVDSRTSFFYYRLDEQAVLLVPNLHWRIEHHFEEIEGADKPLQNRGHEGCWLGLAWQMIEFKLDRAGATLKSEAKIREENGGRPRRFVFDKPFLILMRKRSLSEKENPPFFVMWVDNPELLCKP